jgi:hypothetical protein
MFGPSAVTDTVQGLLKLSDMLKQIGHVGRDTNYFTFVVPSQYDSSQLQSSPQPLRGLTPMASAHTSDYTPFTDLLLPTAHAVDVLFDAILFWFISPRRSWLAIFVTTELQALGPRSLHIGITRYHSTITKTGYRSFC